jgi:hypothetical protein
MNTGGPFIPRVIGINNIGNYGFRPLAQGESMKVGDVLVGATWDCMFTRDSRFVVTGPTDQSVAGALSMGYNVFRRGKKNRATISTVFSSPVALP